MAGLLDAFVQYIRDAMPGGVLNSEFNQSNANRIINDTQRGLLESSGINARDKRRAWNKGLLDAVSGSDDTMSSINQQAFDSVMNLSSIAPMGITAWHGSPHKFDKFDLSKIGTGEGAQAYGHGLYVAEAPETAKSYVNSNYTISHGGKEIRLNNGYAGEDADAALFSKLWRFFGEDENKAHVAMAVLTKQPSDSAAYLKELLEKNAGSKFEPAIREMIANSRFPNNSLYKVDIPDEAVARMLDWDKPLSQQSPEVQKALQPIIDKWMASDNPFKPDALTTTGDILEQARMQHQKGDARIEDTLMRMGIPGIRYLDQGSRGAGGGTSNYVLFSDQLPRIIERNGIETGAKPWAPGEWESFNQGLQK